MNEYVLTHLSDLKNVADVIREATGSTETFSVAELDDVVSETLANSGGGDLDAFIDGTLTELYSEAESVRDYTCYYNGRLLSANIPNATSIGANAFYGCENLATVDFPNVTQIGAYVFESCSKLAEGNFPKAISIGDFAFYGCANLATVDFPNVRLIPSYGFRNCTKLTTVNFPAATSIGTNAFYGCENLATVDFPNVISVGTNAFFNCRGLKALVLRAASVASLLGTNAFSAASIESGTGYIYVPASLKSQYESATNWSTYAAQFRALEDYTVDGTTTGALDETKI